MDAQSTLATKATSRRRHYGDRPNDKTRRQGPNDQEQLKAGAATCGFFASSGPK